MTGLVQAVRWPLARSWMIVLLSVCVIAGGAVPFLGESVDLVLGIAIVGAIWLYLCWRFRNSARFSLVAVLGLFAITHWAELLRMQVQIGGIPIGPGDAVLLTYFLIQGMAAVLEPKKRNSLLAAPEWFLLLAFSMLSLVLGFAFGNQTYYIIKHWRAVVYLVFVFLVTYSLLRTKAQVEQAIQILLVLGTLTAITLWRWSVYTATRSLAYIGMAGLSVQAITKSMDVTAALYLSAYVLILCRLLVDSSLTGQKRLLYFALLLFFLVTIVFSVVRSNWIVAGFGTLYALVVSKRLRPGTALVIVVGLLIGVWLTTQVISGVTGVDSEWILAERFDLEQTGMGRIEDIRQALIAVDKKRGWLFGNGLGAATRFLDVMPEDNLGMREDWTGVHNSYAWYYLNLGLAGLVCILAAIGRIFRVTFVGVRRSRRQGGEWMVMAANVIVLTLAILAMSNNVYQGAPNSIASVGVVWAIALRIGQIWTHKGSPARIERPMGVIE